ncbi:cAMP-binding domain of CRP or a regulatory subunit of cAMP-dependent protein kinases [Catalinimonas alkaloidigena]|uniref:cAMP-binding domain of CRP or a regulatory subunit of cAMP-dependent protein kinases n=1 Tax=Catalinimonas alkaloidigena TaxID=1075417 RepID=A0A1G9FAA7_9BACT|nr:Crp/Fnr family transcriptional regulator [Catalinimonas alkaloidigena]SDK85337.1 cAMP-binding domain of CRP or a regulatory subunit of cAMP-dependent protein kinases [Catalinimonas alkaloidigena]
MEQESSALFSIPLTEAEAQAINECIPIRTFEKGTVLLREGQVATDAYFILRGCIRSYYLLDGDEKTTAFYTEEQSCASLDSYTNRAPATHYLACVEETTVLVLNYEKEQELIRRYPKFESLCRVAVEQDFGKTQEQLARFITSSPEQRYRALLDSRPDLLQRVPQYHLASYLGVTPESLSRIRKRILLKG